MSITGVSPVKARPRPAYEGRAKLALRLMGKMPMPRRRAKTHDRGGERGRSPYEEVGICHRVPTAPAGDNRLDSFCFPDVPGIPACLSCPAVAGKAAPAAEARESAVKPPAQVVQGNCM
jgi:hypothetical protein